MAHKAGFGVAPAPTLGTDAGAIFWRHPDSDIEVFVQPSAAGVIPARALEGLLSNPPTEVAGLLLGGLFPNGHVRQFLVMAVEPIPCESASRDSRFLDFNALMAGACNFECTDHMRPVGYFRSSLRDDLTLTKQDLTVMRECFPPGECVALLIRPEKNRSTTAKFFLGGSGTAVEEQPHRDRPSLAGKADGQTERSVDPMARRRENRMARRSWENQRQDQEDLAPSSPFLVRERRDDLALSVVPDTIDRPAAPRNYTKPLTFVACGLVAMSGLYFYVAGLNRQRLSPGTERSASAVTEAIPGSISNSSEPGLGVQVTRPIEGELDVSWNRSLLAEANGGTVHITDGAVHRNLFLDRLQLQDGRLTYFPRHADVLIQLDVDLPHGRSVSESVRVVGADVMTANSNVLRPMARTFSAPPPIAVAGSSATVPPPGEHLSAPVLVANDAAPGGAPEELLAGNIQLPAPQEPPKVALPDKSKVQVVQESVLPEGSIVLPPPTTVVLPPPAAVDNLPMPTTAPKTAPVSVYIEPKPLRQEVPNISSVMPGGVGALTRIEVGVRVDAKGNVVSAESRSPGNVLTNACLNAARRWTFSPAKLNNRKIDGTYVITFVFKPHQYER